jgi:NAD(P)-dependent dehydrogenase (short-subunit alcohol dehydrogenase family)
MHDHGRDACMIGMEGSVADETSESSVRLSKRLLAGKVGIVTGASRGIGAATARALADAGAAVVLAARDEKALKTVAGEIEAGANRAMAIPTDVGDASAVERMVRLTLDLHGRLDIACNNAAGGGHWPTPLADVAVEDYDSGFRVTLRGVFLCMKHEIPAMIANGGGSIVNMSSTGGLRAVRGLASYVSSKHGVIGLTKVAALDYAEQGIRVNAIAPATIETERIAALDAGHKDAFAKAIPMHRLGHPREVADAAVWLCSEAASFITGETLVIDGGKLSAGA